MANVIDVLEQLAAETGQAVPQIAINWLLTRPTVSSVIIGARNEQQLRQNLGAVGWQLDDEQVARLDSASAANTALPALPLLAATGIRPPRPAADRMRQTRSVAVPSAKLRR